MELGNCEWIQEILPGQEDVFRGGCLERLGSYIPSALKQIYLHLSTARKQIMPFPQQKMPPLKNFQVLKDSTLKLKMPLRKREFLESRPL